MTTTTDSTTETPTPGDGACEILATSGARSEARREELERSNAEHIALVDTLTDMVAEYRAFAKEQFDRAATLTKELRESRARNSELHELVRTLKQEINRRRAA